MKYDSRNETREHIAKVNGYLVEAVKELLDRGLCHDESKLHDPEKKAFDIATPKLKNLTYGSTEYKAACRELGPALTHHYANNSHHPEYYENGVEGMNLLDIVEMLCDWKAAGERHEDGGDIFKSIEINVKRFNMGEMLQKVLINTAEKIFGKLQKTRKIK